MIHSFPEGSSVVIPEQFNNPFRYHPHPLVTKAASILIGKIEADASLKSAFSEGKMLGVLIVCNPESGEFGFTAAFSGNAGGQSIIEGFVPPIYDLLEPTGHFKIKEAEITTINHKIRSIEKSSKLSDLMKELSDAEHAKEADVSGYKSHMAETKKRRDQIRIETTEPSKLEMLLQESRFEKAELKRMKSRWDKEIERIKKEVDTIIQESETLKKARAEMSDNLQKWIFSQYVVHNHYGDQTTIYDIFASEGISPPGGTGECAAPKLLEHAYRNGLRPLAMGEFWYGKSPDTAVRTQGHFYPSCTSKCGPLLGFMMKGIDMELPRQSPENLETLYEDCTIIAVDKPSGMPSVPGLDGRISAFDILKNTHEEIHTVHRLDMDTSGVLLFAKTSEAATDLQRQFESRTISKTYLARLSASPEGICLKCGDKGEVRLPLSPDHDERPRQKVDHTQGKPAVTLYEVISENEDGTVDITFHPHTGRTHQLRIHAAHILGLGRPILGDMLYGGSYAPRLHLHASSISFTHPGSQSQITITSALSE